ncbi:MAG: ABC transporter ATP-binding protein [Pseudomonadota bacterium]
MPEKYTFKYILRLALEHKRTLIIANIIAVLAVVTSVPIPLLIPLLVDEVLLNQPGKVVEAFNSIFPISSQGPILYIGGILVVTVILRVVSAALAVWQTRKFVGVSKEVIYKIRSQLLTRLQSITMSDYETIGSGGVSSLFVTDLNTVDEFAGQTVSKVVVSVLTIIGVAVILFWMHWQLALFIMLMNPAVIYFTISIGKHVKDLKKRENKAFEIFQQSLIETLDGIQQIRASNREKYYLSKVDHLAGNVRDHSAAFSWKSDAANRLSFVIFLIGFDIFRAVGFLMVLFAGLSIGEMIAVFGYLWFMMTPVQDVLNIQYAYYSAKAALGRINQLLYLPNEPKYKHELNPFENQRGVSIQIEDIKFAYGDGSYVLNGVNLSIAAGEKVALVGASGGGKSTLVQVLLGLYPPLFGDIKFNGVSVTRIGMEVVRENVACVLQHPALFNDTLRSNLTLGREMSDEQLWEVLDVAQIRDFVETMPRGLDSIIGRDGVRLSGGQRQRIAIARMALTNPNVVILDEATSALDADTEARVHKSLQEFLKDRTTIIIAHRLSAVKQADRALVFEDGLITEDGTHDQLLDSSGLYAKLYGHQHSA